MALETIEDLQALVNQVMATESPQDIRFELTEKGGCSLMHTPSGRKMVLMLARLGDEFRVGFAYFQPGQKQPLWVDDVLATGVGSQFIMQLIENNLTNPPPY